MEAYGALGFTVESDDELREALEASLASGRVCVIDAILAHSQPTTSADQSCHPNHPPSDWATYNSKP